MLLQKSRTMTAAQAIVECMKMESVEHVFCVPGESYLPILDALYDESSIHVISNRHESGAAFMAEGYAKSMLKPGIVLATRGVGATNLSIGVHTAYQDSTPMIVLLGQVHSDVRGREGFQEIDFKAYFQPITKWVVEVKDAKRIPEIMQRAFRLSQSGRPGPVVISLPEDVLLKEADMYFGPPLSVPKPAPSQADIDEFERLLGLANYPLIIAGGGVKYAEAEDALVNFAESYNIPVMAAFRRHDVFPNNHRLYVGHLGISPHPAVLQTVKESDVILAFGTRLSEVTTQNYSMITPNKKMIHVDIDFKTIGQVYAPHIGVVSDLKEFLQAVMDIHVESTWSEWGRERHDAYIEASRLQEIEADFNKQIISILTKKIPSDALLTTDAGNFAGWLHSFFSFTNKHTFVGPTSGAMGYGMPAALGAKLAHPEKVVVSLSGDGGFMMTMQEIETAVRYEIPIISLIFNNEMYGTIRMYQEMNYPEKVLATNLGDVSFKDIAKSVGAIGHIVYTAEEFASALDESLKNKIPSVIEMMTSKEHISVNSTITALREQVKH